MRRPSQPAPFGFRERSVRVVYVFVAVEVGSRRILHTNVTGRPTAEWTIQQFREFVRHYNRGRPHSSWGPGIPEPTRAKMPVSSHRHKLPAAHYVKSTHQFLAGFITNMASRRRPLSDGPIPCGPQALSALRACHFGGMGVRQAATGAPILCSPLIHANLSVWNGLSEKACPKFPSNFC